MSDLPSLGKPRSKDKLIRGTAIVCGGSLAGLWAARVLSDHYQDVLIIEAEDWLEGEESQSNVHNEEGIEINGRRMHKRTRVYQYHATHGMYWFTYMVLKLLYPNLDEEVRGLHGRVGFHQFNMHCFNKKVLQAPRTFDGDYPKTYFLSREALERLTRRLFLKDRSSIRWMSGVVKGIHTAEDDNNTLTSVTVCLPDNSEIKISASLVADCTGNAQAGLKWLKRLKSPTDVTANGRLAFKDIKLTYNTQQRCRRFLFYIPPETRSELPIPGGYDNAGWLYAFLPLFGNGPKGILCDKIEGHCIRITACVWGGQPLPDWSDLRSFCQNIIPDGTETIPVWFFDMLDILLDYQEQSEYLDTKYPTLSWILYHKAAYIPSNFVALGDSVMQPNPTFGQGISKAIVCAVTLDKLLRSSFMKDETSIPPGFSRKYMNEQAQRTRSAWDATKPIDYLFPTTIPITGEKRSDEFFNAKLSNTLLVIGREDEQIKELLFHAFSFSASASLLLQPYVLFKVLSFWVKQYLGLAPKFPHPGTFI